MWVSAFVFCLFSVGRVRRFFVSCIIVGWVGVLFSFSFALLKMVALFLGVLLVTVSSIVFTSGAAFGQEGDGGNNWLEVVFLPLLLCFFFCC